MITGVEFHPDNGLPMIDDGSGVLRVLAVLPAREHSPFMAAADMMDLPTQAQWQETNMDSWQSPHLTNQGQSSSCVGHATECVVEASFIQAGVELPGPLSGCYVYAWVNGGQDAGAIIGDAAQAVMLHGVALESDVPEGMLFLPQIPRAAHDMAAKIKPSKVLRCFSPLDVFGLASLTIPVVIGISVGRNFSDLDDEGFCPLPDRVVGGHALPVLGLVRSKRWGWGIEVQNSWSRWGMNGTGRARLRLQHFTAQTDAFGVIGPATGPWNKILPAA
jgi:hypothetical protein